MEQFNSSKIITALKIAYPYYFKDLSKMELTGLMQLYNEHFKNYDGKLVEKAIFNITSVDEYMPTIARIKKEIANITLPQKPRAEDEWQEVLRAVRRYGSYREEEGLESLKPFTAYITRLVGFRNICIAEDQTWNKKEFIGEYNAIKDKNTLEFQLGNSQNLKFIQHLNLLKKMEE